jgi:hypothetical protein
VKVLLHADAAGSVFIAGGTRAGRVVRQTCGFSPFAA